MEWPKKSTRWIIKRTLFISIPFTWDLLNIKRQIKQRSFEYDQVVIGGPAVYLMPDFFNDINFVSVGFNMPGVLQRINPLATRTTIGCIRQCAYCGVPIFDGRFKELKEWPNLPIICDNNLLAASQPHFDRVINRLKKHNGVDFNQGLDTRLLTDYHAMRIAEINGIAKRGVRLALDNMAHCDTWNVAFERLRSAGIAKRKISTYALVGFDSGPLEAWARCEWIEEHGTRVLPMWFHELNQLEKNIVTEHQGNLGWDDLERKRIMRWYYQHNQEYGKSKHKKPEVQVEG